MLQVYFENAAVEFGAMSGDERRLAAPPAMWPEFSRNTRRCGRAASGTRDQYAACARTSAIPDPSSTADDHGPSWCEPMITVSSSAPGSSPTTL
jgi:hypothetical protein